MQLFVGGIPLLFIESGVVGEKCAIIKIKGGKTFWIFPPFVRVERIIFN